MKLKQLIMTAIALAMLMITQAVTQADPLIFSNPPPVVVTGQGSTVAFSITITNSGLGSLTITEVAFGGFNRISDNLSDSGLLPDIEPGFINFVLAELTEGQSLSGVALNLIVGPDVAFGTYLGEFTISYIGENLGETSVSQEFVVTVVPEPTTMILLGTGLAGAAGAKLRKRWRAKT